MMKRAMIIEESTPNEAQQMKCFRLNSVCRQRYRHEALLRKMPLDVHTHAPLINTVLT